jgi:hypothetical protein
VDVNLYLMGAITLAYAVAGLFFLRFWRQTRDPLFLVFALAFWVLAGIRLILAAAGEDSEAHTLLYLLRLAAFGMILLAILYKNVRK